MVKLFIGTKKYSSWSLRPWSLCVEKGLAFDEVKIPFDAVEGEREFTSEFKQNAFAIGPTSRVPILHHGNSVIWESLSICQYISSMLCNDALWPEAGSMRAHAFSLATEVQSEFLTIREEMPFWCVPTVRHQSVVPVRAAKDWLRLERAISDALELSGGPFLYGEYSIADAMVLPMMSRAYTYLNMHDSPIETYYRFSLSRPAYVRWVAEASREPEVLPELERFSREFRDRRV
ncbi:glutathione S-transferase family protein [Paraburkholderia caribensis]|uniref:glutathione S-transferase family protein n=1 Tax=Paraburkholderia caribensis TaxID=75105 RepID=UPI0009EE9E32|nr:glutathione S-transferase family protein [Paraburkholderia caribensis]